MNSSRSPLVCVIVHYGDADITTDCVASLLAGSHIPQIIVVSNADSAGTQALREAMHRRGLFSEGATGADAATDAEGLCVLPLGTNKGFAAACNAGLGVARQRAGLRFAWLLNNDACVAADAAERLLSCLERHPRALCGTSVFRADAPEKLELALGCRFSPLSTIIRPCHAGAPPQDVAQTPAVDYIYGASLAFPVSLLDAIGLLDERFFLYYEEHDFCARARAAGYAFLWCREARVWHGFVSPRKTPSSSSRMREFKHFHETRSTVLFMRKHHAVLLLPAMLIRLVGKVFVLWRQGELGLLKSYVRGIVAGISRPKV